MSITSTLKSPPIWSPAYNPIVWEVQSDQVSQFKFRYVFDVYINDGTYLRYKIPANPAGSGLIDVSSLVQGSLTVAQNLPFLSSLPFYSGEGLAARVYCKVGEEYAPSATSDPVLYNGLGVTGAPAYGLYADGDFRPAPNSTTPVVAWASGQGANENYDYMLTSGEDILQYEMALGGITPDTGGKFLTRCPDSPQTIRSDEDFTLTWLNRNFETGATGYVFPYAMKVEYYNEGSKTGESEYIATAANGGVWPTCSALPPLATGASGPANLLYSFKINPSDAATFVRTKDNIWGMPVPPYPGWKFGYYVPYPDVFPNAISSGLTPPYTGAVNIVTYDDTWLGVSPNNATGSTEIIYKAMDVPATSVLEIEMGSSNSWGTDFPEFQLWGCTGATLTTGSNWEKITDFTPSEQPVGSTYYTINTTTTKHYYALGLRFKVASPTQYNPTYIGPTGYPEQGPLDCIQKWTITSPLVADFDKMCLTLYPYDPADPCALGPTASSETICLEINDQNCWGFEPIRFAWLNNLGGRDWYTFMKRNTYTQNATRDTFYQLPGYWSTAQWSIQDLNPSRWGTTVFKAQLTNSWTASTDWITEEQSDWLRGMFASPSVHAYLPGRSTPTLITITDANYSVQTYAREKLFQYFVSFVEAQPDVVQSY